MHCLTNNKAQEQKKKPRQKERHLIKQLMLSDDTTEPSHCQADAAHRDKQSGQRQNSAAALQQRLSRFKSEAKPLRVILDAPKLS